MLSKDILYMLVRRSSITNVCPYRTFLHKTTYNNDCPTLDQKANSLIRCYIRSIIKTNNSFTFLQTRFKGHAHWQNVRSTKLANSKKAGALKHRSYQSLVAAMRANGPNPKLNPDLERLIKDCQSANIPKASVQKWIENFKNRVAEEPVYIELNGPKGIVFVLKLLTDSMSMLEYVGKKAKKSNAPMVKSHRWQKLFDQKGVITVLVDSKTDLTNMDKYVEIAIESGAEDVIVTDIDVGAPDVNTALKFHCDSHLLNSVADEIRDTFDLKVHSMEVDLIPHRYVTLDTEEEVNYYQTVLDTMSSCEEVLKIFDNISMPEE